MPCTVESLQKFAPPQGVVVESKVMTGQPPNSQETYLCHPTEDDATCMRRVSQSVSNLGTDMTMHMGGKVRAYLGTFILDGERYQGEFPTERDVLNRLDSELAKGKKGTIETVVPIFDTEERLVIVDLQDRNASADPTQPRVMFVWDPKSPDMWASLGALEDSAAAHGVQPLPGKWRNDGRYEFELVCPSSKGTTAGP